MYISFYFYSEKINGENAYHNYFACLAVTFLQLIVMANIIVLYDAVVGFDFKWLFDDLSKIAFALFLIAIFLANYTYFTVSSRYKKIIREAVGAPRRYMPFYGVFAILAFSITLVLAFFFRSMSS